MSAIAQRNRREQQTIRLDGRSLEYAVRTSKTSKKCRVRIGPAGIEVIVPREQPLTRAESFLTENSAWVLDQVDRVSNLDPLRLQERPSDNCIMLRGNETKVVVETEPSWKGKNKVSLDKDTLTVKRSVASETATASSIEYWLRKEARKDIEACLKQHQSKLDVSPNRVYVMGQRTKWGNCSTLGNLSFNWRLVMAPSEVLEYIVVHELVHLLVPDHSAKFWFTVRSFCSSSESSRDWLRKNGESLMRVELPEGGA